MERTKLKDRILPIYTKGEEIFNMTSHIVGAAFGIVALVICVGISAYHQNMYALVSSIIYGLSIIVLYTMSSIYHGLGSKMNAKKSFSNIRPLFNISAYSWFIYSILSSDV